VKGMIIKGDLLIVNVANRGGDIGIFGIAGQD